MKKDRPDQGSCYGGETAGLRFGPEKGRSQTDERPPRTGNGVKRICRGTRERVLLR